MSGPLLESLVRKELNLIKVPSSQDRGDIKNSKEEYFEVKTGFLSDSEKIKLQQVRPFQDLKAYLCFHYDPYLGELLIHTIDKEKMSNICSTIISSSHGAGNNEKGVTLKTEDFKDYRMTLEEVRNFVR